MNSESIAARAGRWSAQHRRKAILGWLAFVVVAVAIGGTIGTKTLEPHELGFGESGRADVVLHDAGLKDAIAESVLVTPADPAAIADLQKRARALDEVELVREPVIKGNAALVQVQVDAGYDDAADAVPPITAAVDAVRKAHPGVALDQTGDASVMKAFDDTIEEDFQKAEMFSIPITFAIL